MQSEVPQGENQKDEHRLDFILETETPKPKTFLERLLTPAGIILTTAGIVAIVVLITIPVVLNQRANQAQIDKLVGLAQSQSEIIRISSFAEKEAKYTSTKARANNITTTVNESLDQVEQSLQNRGVENEQLILSGQKDSQTDSSLIAAIQEDNFDEIWGELMDEQLLDYQRLILEAQAKSNAQERQMLEDAYGKSNDLLGLKDEL